MVKVMVDSRKSDSDTKDMVRLEESKSVGWKIPNGWMKRWK
jgi:hypothetical protein